MNLVANMHIPRRHRYTHIFCLASLHAVLILTYFFAVFFFLQNFLFRKRFSGIPFINVSNSVTPDQVTVSVGSDLCLQCLQIRFLFISQTVPREAANVVSMFEISVVSSYPR